MLRRLLRPPFGPSLRPGGPRTGLAYWDDRARTYGARSVLNLGHRKEEVESVTRSQWETILPHLARSLRGDERVALDFGCGPGRFTPRLAELIHGRAVGVDPIQTLLDLAPKRPDVEYLVGDGHRIPLPDAGADVVWVCLVLGGIPDRDLPAVAREIGRVLRPGGLLFLVENTASGVSCDHWFFRPVDYYLALFPFAALAHLGDYYDLDQRISILAGRKR